MKLNYFIWLQIHAVKELPVALLCCHCQCGRPPLPIISLLRNVFDYIGQHMESRVSTLQH